MQTYESYANIRIVCLAIDSVVRYRITEKKVIAMKTDKISLFELSYMIFWAILTFAESVTMPDKTTNNLCMFSCVFLVISLLNTKWTYKEILIMGLLFIISVIVYYNNRRIGILMTVSALIGMKNISIDRLLKMIFILRATIFLTFIVLYLLKITAPIYTSEYRIGGVFTVKHDFGFNTHPNIVSMSYYIIFILFLYLYYDRFKLRHAVLFMIGYYLVFLGTQSRTTIICLAATLILLVLAKMDKLCRYKYITTLFIPLCAFGSLFLAMSYRRLAFTDVINQLMQTRIYFANWEINKYGFSLFGVWANSYINEYSMYRSTDMAYIQIAIEYGMVTFLLYVISFSVLIYRFCIAKNNRALVFTLGFSIYLLTEAFALMPVLNLPLIFLAKLIYQEPSPSPASLKPAIPGCVTGTV